MPANTKSKPAGTPDVATASTTKPETNGHADDCPVPDQSGIEMVHIEYRGEIFSVPKHADDWRTRDLETLYQAPNVFDVVRACIGQQQWERFNRMFPKHREFKEFRDVLGATMRDQCVGL